MGNCFSQGARPPAASAGLARSRGYARAFLSNIGLQVYVQAFELCAYDNEAVLCDLDELDLDKIERASHVPILPSHRTQILMASAKLQQQSMGLLAGFQRSTMPVSIPSLAMRLSSTTLGAGGMSLPDTSWVSPASSFTSWTSSGPEEEDVLLPLTSRGVQQKQQQQQQQQWVDGYKQKGKDQGWKKELPLQQGMQQRLWRNSSSSSSTEWPIAWVQADFATPISSNAAAAAASSRASSEAAAACLRSRAGSRSMNWQQSLQQQQQQHRMSVDLSAASLTSGAPSEVVPVLQSGFVQFAPCRADFYESSDRAN